MNSFDRRKDNIMNDLRSAEGRYDSSEIIDLEKEVKEIDKKINIHNIQQGISESKTDLENEIKIQELENKLQNNEKIEITELQNICKEPIIGGKNMQVIPFNSLESLLKTNNLLEGTKTEEYKKLIEKGFILGQGEPRIYNGERRGGENAVHLGIDYMVKSGNDVGAIYGGKIVNIETPTPGMGGHNGGGYGNMIMIKHRLHGKNFYSLYGHISPTKTFKLGDQVKKGEIIAKVAESFSAASGGWPSHLHFMMIQEGGTNGGYGNIEETNNLIDPLKISFTQSVE